MADQRLQCQIALRLSHSMKVFVVQMFKCYVCDFSLCHLSHFRYSVAEHSSREPSVVGSEYHLRQLMFSLKKAISGVIVLYCVALFIVLYIVQGYTLYIHV